MKPFFSIIIPTLNEEKYLSKLLFSLTKQTYRSFEVIVVDGESEDKTQYKAEKFSGEFPAFLLINTKKKGPGIQRNLGAKKASGKYLVFMDADVQAPPEFLEGIHYEIVRHKSVFITTWVQEDSNITGDKMIVTMYNLILEISQALNKPAAAGFNIIIKKNIFYNAGGFNKKVIMSEDVDLTTRLGKAGYDVTILKEPKLKISMRRLRTEGTIQIIRKFVHAHIHFILKGPITTQLFEYQMGGHVHERARIKRKYMTNLNRYKLTVQKISKRFNHILENSL